MQNSTNSPEAPSNSLIKMAVRRALSGAMLSGAVATTFGAGSAQAQQGPAAPPAAGGEAELQEVVVTGSRIKQPALEAVSPVTTVTAAEIKQSGTTRIEDLLNQLPQVVADMGSSLSNGATGAATVSLRGLGCERTLVLVNGRRLMPGDPTEGGTECADLNQIPSALVENVDVLTGGASAVYGADAVAGVVNFKMNDHFEGVRLDVNDGFYNHSQHDGAAAADEAAAGFSIPTGSTTDGQTADFTALLGSNFDEGRGNAVMYLGYRHTDPVLQGSRDFSACSLTSSGPARVCGGSGTTFPTLFSLNNKAAGYVGDYSVGAGGALVPTSSLPAGGLYNYAPANYFQRPDDRYTGGAFAHYDVNDHARAYLEFQFMDDRTLAQIAPSGAFTGAGLGVTSAGVPTGAWAINCANPYLSTSEYTAFGCTSASQTVQVTLGRRNVEGGDRVDDLGHTSFRTVLGVKGDLNDAWSYDTYFQNGITRFSEEYDNDVSKLNMANALQAVKEPNGQIVCAANANGANNAPGCVPWNIFQPGGVTPAAAAYISVPGEQKGYTQEEVWEATVTGDLGKMGIQLPTASSGLGVSVGADWREEKTQLLPDEEFITNDLAGQGSPTLPTYGAFTVWELYTEERLPLLDDQPFAKSLDLEAGYRFSDYSLSFGSTNTWKLGLQWAPISDFHLRAMYNVAVRAPNIQELYLQQRVQLDGTADPCASSAPGVAPTASLAQCEASGVTKAEYGNILSNPANQYNGLEGGNANLKPETADTTTLGVVFTPTFLPEFNATIDYYNIRIKNVISTYTANLILDNCLNTANPLFCSLVHRAPATGSVSDGSLWLGTLGYITDSTLNLGELQQQGFDFTFDYRFDAGLVGKFNFNLNGNYDLHFKTTPYVGSGTYDCAGYYGPSCGADGGVMPRIKTIFTINYTTPLPGLETWLKWRFIGPVKVQNLSQNPLLAAYVSPIEGIGNQVPGYNYLDLGVSYQVSKQITTRVGVNNLLDKDPPIIQAEYGTSVLDSGNTYPQTYDWGGRYLFANVTVDF